MHYYYIYTIFIIIYFIFIVIDFLLITKADNTLFNCV